MENSPDRFVDLLHRARDGERTAIDELLQRHLQTVRAFVRLRSGRMLRRMESQSDLVQSICREVLGDLADFRSHDEQAFKQWLLAVAHRKILAKVDYHNAEKRRASRQVELDTGGDSTGGDRGVVAAYGLLCTPSRHAELNEEIERIERAFDKLPDDYREVLTMACLAGTPHREIAQQMNRSEPAIRQLLSRARARLALLLE